MNESETLSFEGADAIRLVADAWGDPTHPPILLSHGGGQTRHSWQSTAQQLAALGRYVINYDHRGHGDSGWSPDGIYRLDTHAADQKKLAQTLSRPPVVVGASLGGLSALLAEGEAAQSVYRAIVLVDITPQMNREGAMEIMTFMEETMHDGFDTLETAAEVIARYTGRKKKINPQGLEKNLRLGEDGKYRWHWDPNFLSLRDDFSGKPERLLAATRNVDVPIMLVRGRDSNVVTEEVAREFLQIVPSARCVDVADARHMVAGDKNEIFTRAVMGFIEELSP